MHARALKRLRKASKSDELASSNRLAYLMFRWRDLAADEGVEVKAWAKKQMENDAMIATFATAFTSHSWSQSSGDTVAKRHTQANVGSLAKVLDRDKLRERVEQVAAKGGADAAARAVSEFLTAWRKQDTGDDD